MHKQVMLVVEDSPLAMTTFHEIFDEEYMIVEAYDGIEALAFLKEATQQISVILLDIVMPNLNGLDLLRLLSSDVRFKEIPTVAITSETKYQLNALELGAWDYIPKSSHKKVIEARVRNVIERSKYSALKKVEEQLRLSENTLRAAIIHADMHFWVYDIVNNCAYEGEKACEDFHIPKVLNNYPQSWIVTGYMLPKYAEKFLKMHQASRDGAPMVVQDVEIVPPGTDMPKWFRIKYTNVFDEQGRPLKAFGTGADITEQKSQAERYNAEISYREQIYQNQHIYAISIDLNTDVVEYISSNYHIIMTPQEVISYDDFHEKYSKTITDEAHRQKVKEFFNRKALINAYHQGNRTISYDFKYSGLCGEGHEWMNTTVSLLKKPDSGHITAFIYTKSITDEKVVKAMIHTIIQNDYDCVLLIDSATLSAKNYGVSSHFCWENIPYIENFEFYLHSWLKKCCIDKDKNNLIEAMTLSNIVQVLKTEKQYCVSYTVCENGVNRRKQDKYTYINGERRLICYTRYDITEVWEKENKKMRFWVWHWQQQNTQT